MWEWTGRSAWCGSRQEEAPGVAVDRKKRLDALFVPACALCGTPCCASLGNAPSHATMHKQQSLEGERWGEGASGPSLWNKSEVFVHA